MLHVHRHQLHYIGQSSSFTGVTHYLALFLAPSLSLFLPSLSVSQSVFLVPFSLLADGPAPHPTSLCAYKSMEG